MTSLNDSHGTPGQLNDAQVLADRYHLDRRVGQGGMAEVWVAIDKQLDRRVAVKWLKSNLATDAVVAERFRREAIAVARLNHPNIVSVHDVFEHDGRQAVECERHQGFADHSQHNGPTCAASHSCARWTPILVLFRGNPGAFSQMRVW